MVSYYSENTMPGIQSRQYGSQFEYGFFLLPDIISEIYTQIKLKFVCQLNTFAHQLWSGIRVYMKVSHGDNPVAVECIRKVADRHFYGFNNRVIELIIGN